MFTRRLKNLTPYVPGEQPRDRRYIKLNTNENPYPPSPAVADYLNNVDVENLRRYPDPLFTELRAALSERYGVEADQVFVGNGSDEVLSFMFYAFFDSDHRRFVEHDALITYVDQCIGHTQIYSNVIGEEVEESQVKSL